MRILMAKAFLVLTKIHRAKATVQKNISKDYRLRMKEASSQRLAANSFLQSHASYKLQAASYKLQVASSWQLAKWQ